MTVSHCERFYTVSAASTALAVVPFDVNPGLGSVFPWLSDVANRFDKYKFTSVKFRYVPQAAAQAGTVTLAFDFDPNDDAPSTMSEAATYHDYVMTSIWNTADLSLDLGNGDKLPQKNTRPGMPGADLDLNMYDVGKLYLLTEGAAAGVLGYLEVIYTVNLFVHQVQAGVGGKMVATAGLTPTALFGTDVVPDASAHLPGYASAAGTFTFTQPFEGVMIHFLTGTVFNALGCTNTGTATYTGLGGRYPTAATTFYGAGRVRAEVGQTLILAYTSTTVTAAEHWFARAPYASLA